MTGDASRAKIKKISVLTAPLSLAASESAHASKVGAQIAPARRCADAIVRLPAAEASHDSGRLVEPVAERIVTERPNGV